MTQNQTDERVESSGPLAYTQSQAAEQLGISLRSLCRRIQAGLLVPTRSDRTISREELCRYLRQETTAARKGKPLAPPKTARKRVPRSQYQPIPLHASV